MTPFSTKQRLAIAAAVLVMLAVALIAGSAFKRFESSAPDRNAPEPGAKSATLDFGGRTRMSGNRVPATDLVWSFFAAHPKQ